MERQFCELAGAVFGLSEHVKYEKDVDSHLNTNAKTVYLLANIGFDTHENEHSTVILLTPRRASARVVGTTTNQQGKRLFVGRFFGISEFPGMGRIV